MIGPREAAGAKSGTTSATRSAMESRFVQQIIVNSITLNYSDTPTLPHSINSLIRPIKLVQRPVQDPNGILPAGQHVLAVCLLVLHHIYDR